MEKVIGIYKHAGKVRKKNCLGRTLGNQQTLVIHKRHPFLFENKQLPFTNQMCVKQLGRQLTKKGLLCCHFSSKKTVGNFLKDYDQLSFGFDLSKAVVEVWTKLYIPSTL